jgi:hypothetical protein
MDSLIAILLGVAGVILTAVFKYWPEAKAWYLKQAHQGLVMLGLVAVVALGYFGLGCYSLTAAQLHISLTCDVNGGLQLAQAFVAIAIGNQLAYLYLPDVKP